MHVRRGAPEVKLCALAYVAEALGEKYGRICRVCGNRTDNGWSVDERVACNHCHNLVISAARGWKPAAQLLCERATMHRQKKEKPE